MLGNLALFGLRFLNVQQLFRGNLAVLRQTSSYSSVAANWHPSRYCHVIEPLYYRYPLSDAQNQRRNRH